MNNLFVLPATVPKKLHSLCACSAAGSRQSSFGICENLERHVVYFMISGVAGTCVCMHMCNIYDHQNIDTDAAHDGLVDVIDVTRLSRLEHSTLTTCRFLAHYWT